MASKWYANIDGKQQGPFGWEDLFQKVQDGVFKPTDLVWTEKMADWARVDTIKGLLTEPIGSYGSDNNQSTRLHRKRNAVLVILIGIMVVVFLGVAVFFDLFSVTGALIEKTSLEAELPGDTWESIVANFTFDPDETKYTREVAAHPLSDTEWWVFTYSGSVEEAFFAIVAPNGSEVIPPYEVSLGTILQDYLLDWEHEHKEKRDSAWLKLANARVEEWENRMQFVAEVNFFEKIPLSDQHSFMNLPWPKYRESHSMEIIAWSLLIVSPLVDMEEFTLSEETYLLVIRNDFSY